MVTKYDLIGDIKNLPIEVVERMLYHQQIQGNVRNIKIFQAKRDTSRRLGGFDWGITKNDGEGIVFWAAIINTHYYNDFFQKYPRPSATESVKDVVEEVKEVETSTKPDVFNIGDLVLAPLNDTDFSKSNRIRVYIGKLENSESPYIVMTPESYARLKEGKNGDIVTCSKIKKVTPKGTIVKLTLQDISEGKGIGIDPELIRIVK